MPVRPQAFRPKSQPSQQVMARQADKARGTARERGYSTAWDKAAKGHRRSSPLCRYCDLRDGGIAAATHTDHLYPHLTYEGVFWWSELWVSCCGPCHSGFKQQVERQGRRALDRLARQLGLATLSEATAARGEGGV